MYLLLLTPTSVSQPCYLKKDNIILDFKDVFCLLFYD